MAVPAAAAAVVVVVTEMAVGAVPHNAAPAADDVVGAGCAAVTRLALVSGR